MYFVALTTLLSLLTPKVLAAFGGDTSLTAVKQAFNANDIPSALDISFNPVALFEVALPEANGAVLYLKSGNEVPLDETFGPPAFFGILNPPPSIGRGPFVVAAVDPDAPPGVAEVRHILGGGYTLGSVNSDGVTVLATNTPPVSTWINPQPPAGEPPHRYTFLLFKQSAAFATQTLVTPSTPVTGFDIASFAAAVGLGDPLGGTFILVANTTAA